MAASDNTCPCPTGYVRDQSGLNCVKTTQVAAVNNGTTYTVGSGVQSGAYGQFGSDFYQDITALNFPITYTVHLPNDILKDSSGHILTVSNTVINSLWGNANAANGRLNNAGVWTTAMSGINMLPIFEWIGFSACIDVPTTGTYCIGLAADNSCRFSLNGQLLVEIDNIGMGSGYTFPFNRWHVFPITLQAGQNIITVEGLNYGLIATFAAEIYNATPVQLAALTTPAQLSAVTLFTTSSKVGQSFQTGTQSGYSCPDGYSLNTCTPNLSCTIVENIPYNCCYQLTNCATGATIITNTNVSAYVGQAITIVGSTGCWSVTTALDCATTVPVTVSGTFFDCQSCAPCFRLVNCITGAVIITSTNLSSSVGQTVNLSGTYAGCWTVTTSPDCTGSVAVTYVSTTPTCFSCLPCFILRNCLNEAQTLTTNINLTAYLGQTVQISGYPDTCWTVQQTSGCTQSAEVVIVKAFANCTTCKKKCYLLVDCTGVEPSIVVNNDLSASLGFVVQIKGCVDVCWTVQQSDTCVGAVDKEITATFQTCALCNPPIVCPAPELLRQRKVYPGYSTPGCSTEYTEKVNCEFSEQIYNQVKKRRYGITTCCEDDYQKWLIKKKLLDLRAIWDPELCVTCAPISCCTPCPTPVEPTPPTPIACLAPTSITAVIEIITSCSNITGTAGAQISFNNSSTTGFNPPIIT